ncbi:MAG TPA: PHP domain-containing protein [Bacteroides sp.]|nr:PHP domain-containing protein [Bacteroides sp.]
MNNHFHVRELLIAAFLGSQLVLWGQSAPDREQDRRIEFPDIPGYSTLVCDLHMHTVFSDGSVWPSIRVQEALREGLDAISITDHIEYQPHRNDIPHPDMNRSYELALKAAGESDLIVIRGAEITRSMPPGHANAIFLEDVNALNRENVMEVFREARRQGAYIFWNHPHWTAQRPDGIATLTDMHLELISEGLLQGIEVVNELIYSDEALQIALDHDLAILGNSDIHGPTDWLFRIPEGGHRPVTLVFATEKSPEALKEALFGRRTVVWFDNTLVGKPEYLIPLVRQSLSISAGERNEVQMVNIANSSDAEYLVENLSGYTFHAHADILVLPAHETTILQVKTKKPLSSFDLAFRILNAVVAPGTHPEVTWTVEPE